MGRAAIQGARLGAEDAARAASLLDRDFALLEETAAGPGEAASAAERLVDRGASAVVGGFGDDVCAALVETAGRLGVPFLNVGARADRFRERACSRTAFHVQASETMYLDAAVHWLVRRSRQGIVEYTGSRQELWRWFFVHQDDEQGREFVERAAAILERAGGEPMGRTPMAPDGGDAAAALEEARARDPWAVVAIAQGDALARLAEEHEASRAGFDFVLPFGDERRFEEGWAPEAFWPSLWHSGNFRYGATQLNDRFSDRFGRPMGPQAWANWTAVKLLGDLLVGEPATPGADLPARIEEEVAFDGYKGPPLSFRPWNHQMEQPMDVLHPSVGDTVEDPYQRIGRVPVTSDDQYISPELAERLGPMGRSEEESRCRMGEAPARAQ
jgi:ABC-type branched-subunit amino acid transport system substrate-binding protein